jgi:MFS transporter, OFA family, oxalate/formate antiporter
MQSSPVAVGAIPLPPTNRWLQLVIGVVCMVMIANLQYGWTLFVKPLGAANGWTIAEIQVAFALFVALETWLTPIEGWLADWIGPKSGPRLVVAFGGVFVALGWIVNSVAGSLSVLYLGAILSGVGAGAVYATCVGNAVKWFPDRRGLAVGLTAAGFGAGAALTVVPIREVIDTYGYGAAFFWFGLIQGAVVSVLAWKMRAPLPNEVPSSAPSKIIQTDISYSPREMMATPIFWVLYVMFVLV